MEYDFHGFQIYDFMIFCLDDFHLYGNIYVYISGTYLIFNDKLGKHRINIVCFEEVYSFLKKNNVAVMVQNKEVNKVGIEIEGTVSRDGQWSISLQN